MAGVSGANNFLKRRPEMGMETIVILLLVIFIVGLIVGVVVARPTHVH
jgi:hypothetical protein